MDELRHIELMHAVLDGEASPAQVRELQRLMAADPAVREEYAALERVFAALREVQQPYVPEGLYASVMDNLPAAERARQLSAASRVIERHDEHSPDSGTSKRSRRPEAPPARQRERLMSEQPSFGKRKAVWIGASVAALAVVVVATGIYPPSDGNTTGAIVPAQRFRAEQPTSGGVAGGGSTDAAPRAQAATGAGSGDAMKDGRVVDGRMTDGRAADAKASDARALDARASDARAMDAKASDARALDAKGSDARALDAKGSDARALDAKASDARALDAKGSDARALDAKASDARALDAKASDARALDAKGSDARALDAKASDARALDAKGSDARAMDAKGSDARAMDAKTSDARAADAKTSDGRAADSKKSDGRAADGKADARKSDARYQ